MFSNQQSSSLEFHTPTPAAMIADTSYMQVNGIQTDYKRKHKDFYGICL